MYHIHQCFTQEKLLTKLNISQHPKEDHNKNVIQFASVLRPQIFKIANQCGKKAKVDAG